MQGFFSRREKDNWKTQRVSRTASTRLSWCMCRTPSGQDQCSYKQFFNVCARQGDPILQFLRHSIPVRVQRVVCSEEVTGSYIREQWTAFILQNRAKEGHGLADILPLFSPPGHWKHTREIKARCRPNCWLSRHVVVVWRKGAPASFSTYVAGELKLLPAR